jgi:tRNA U34 5-methylaminomethyl-2-thiouridine-forming methyltransferase MnmC
MTQAELDALKALALETDPFSRDHAQQLNAEALIDAVPALCDEVERLTAQVAELEAELAAVRYSYAAAMDGERP